MAQPRKRSTGLPQGVLPFQGVSPLVLVVRVGAFKFPHAA